jgi:hypothetical protein
MDHDQIGESRRPGPPDEGVCHGRHRTSGGPAVRIDINPTEIGGRAQDKSVIGREDVPIVRRMSNQR